MTQQQKQQKGAARLKFELRFDIQAKRDLIQRLFEDEAAPRVQQATVDLFGHEPPSTLLAAAAEFLDQPGPWCSSCGAPCICEWADHGIGPHEYWGSGGCHVEWHYESECCGAEPMTDATLASPMEPPEAPPSPNRAY